MFESGFKKRALKPISRFDHLRALPLVQIFATEQKLATESDGWWWDERFETKDM